MKHKQITSQKMYFFSSRVGLSSLVPPSLASFIVLIIFSSSAPFDSLQVLPPTLFLPRGSSCPCLPLAHSSGLLAVQQAAQHAADALDSFYL